MTTDLDQIERDEAPGHGHRHLGAALAIISVAQLMVVLDATIVNIAIPYIDADLGFSDASLSWIVTGYTLAFGGLLLLGGRLGDLLGRRRVFIVGVLIFAIASLLGGWLTEYSWRLTFLINVPIGVAAAVLAPMFLGESGRRRGTFGIAGALTGTLGLLSLVYGLTYAAEASWSDARTVVTLVVGVVLLAAFLVIERVVRQPLMPFRILANRTRGVSFFVMMLVPAAMFAMFYFLSQLIQNVLGYSSLEAGFAFLPFSFGIVASATLASQLMTRVDPRWLAGVGTLLAAVGLFGFSLIDYDANPATLGVEASYVTDLLPWILVMSFGMGMVFVPLTLTAVHGVGDEDSGIGSGVLNAMQQVGGALGLATLSTVFVASATNKGTQIATAARGPQERVGIQPTPEELEQFKLAAGDVAFTHGATIAFIAGPGMILLGALAVFAFMNVEHEELATDCVPGVPAA